MFSKVVHGQEVKTRLRSVLSREEAELFHVVSLADTLETVLHADTSAALFLQGGESAAARADLRQRLENIGWDGTLWSSLEVRTQEGESLGERLENAFANLFRRSPGVALIVGSDSPDLKPDMLRYGLEALAPAGDPSTLPPDLVLGPTVDGGYWAIGGRQVPSGLLRDVAWSTERALMDTLSRARELGLRTLLLPRWSDVDRPEDLQALARHLQDLRRSGDRRTGRHCERFLESRGLDGRG